MNATRFYCMHRATPTHHRLRGLALPSVLVMLFLCASLTLTAWRSLWLNELLLQARADALHTQNWADATLLAALDDVLQRTGNTVSNTASNSASNIAAQRYRSGSDTDRHVFIPATVAQLEMLRLRLGHDACREGLCAPLQPLSWLATDRQTRWASGMPVVFDNAASQGNNTPGPTTHYWIEIFLQADAQDSVPAAPVWVYRITAMASGLKSAAPTVLQAIWLQPMAPEVGPQTKTDASELEAGTKAEATSTPPPDAVGEAAPSIGRWISWTVWHDPP